MDRAARPVLVGLAAAWLVAAGGVTAYLQSDAHALHDPQHGLQQLDLLHLDEPAPGAAALGLSPGRAHLLLFCDTCELPAVDGAEVVRVRDQGLAAAYALLRPDGTVGPGYVLVDRELRVRYRTYDPAPAEHLAEVQPLVDALRSGA